MGYSFRSVLICVALIAGGSCGGSKNSSSGGNPTSPTPAATPSTTFQGIIAGTTNQTGTLTVTVQAQVAAVSPSFFKLPFVVTLHAQGTSVTATGSVRAAGGSATALTGTYDTSSRALSLSGSGFTFTGSASGAVLSGTYTGPSGVAGRFSSRSTAGGAVTVYCGNIFGRGNSANEITGVFNFVVSDTSGAVSGAFIISADTPPTVGSITGQVSGTALSFTGTSTSGRFAGETITGTATIQAGSITGTGGGNAISGSTSRCQ